MKLIDADEARRRIIAFATGLHSEVLPVDTVMMILIQMPIVDAIPVVRCGQCKFDNICCRNVGKDGKRTKDDFCSYGERKEGADNS